MIKQMQQILFDDQRIPVLAINPAGEVVASNPAGYKLLSISQENSTSKSLYHYLSDVHKSNLKDKMKNYESPTMCELALIKKTDSIRAFQTFIQKIDNKKDIFQLTLIEISRIKRLENSLNESANNYLRLIESMSVGLSLHEVIKSDNGEYDFRLILFNEKLEEIVGSDLSSSTGSLLSEQTFPQVERIRHLFSEVAKTGKPQTFTNYIFPNCTADLYLFSTGKEKMVVLYTDVTEKIKVSRELAYSGIVYQTLAENMPDMITRFDTSFKLLYVNSCFEHKVNLQRNDICGKNINEVFKGEVLLETFKLNIQKVVDKGKSEVAEFYLDPMEDKKCYEAHFVPEFNAIGSVESVLCVARDISEHKQSSDILRQLNSLLQLVNGKLEEQVEENEKLQRELQELVLRDPLTGIYNRRYLTETIEREVARAIRTQTPLSLIILDVDFFKRINDTYGHDEGDVILKSIASNIMKNVRASDVACRYGGEEFVILMPGMSKEDAFKKAEQIRKFVSASTALPSAEKKPVTISLGIATLSEHVEGEKELLIYADRALYYSKKNGRNRTTAWHPGLAVPASD